MRIETSVILFCYAFICGIAAGRFAPADPGVRGVLAGLTFAAFLAALVAAWFGGRSSVGRGRVRWLTVLAMMFAGLMLGYSRHHAATTAPNLRLATVRIDRDGVSLPPAAPAFEAGRIRIAREGPGGGDLRLRIVGELDARVAAADEAGGATLDANGRWRFVLAPVAVTSDVVVLRADAPAGSGVSPPQPFSRITGVERIDGEGTVGLYRIANHLRFFSGPGARPSPTRVLGFISGDPIVYDYKTVLPVTPQFLQDPPGGPWLRVEGGSLQVSLYPDCPGYAEFSSSAAYGRAVELEGALNFARGPANPGGFDARRFLLNSGVHGLMRMESRGRPRPPIRFVGPDGGGGPVRRNPLVAFSLDLRDRLTNVIKASVLHPQSAFVGGVTLGLRYGLQGVECIFSPVHRADGSGGEGGCHELIAEEFKAAGINHVLAVSGLHVTILTVMMIGIFSLMRLPRQAYAPLVLLALVIFAIITGARPSTLRAVIMNGLTLTLWAYVSRDLRASVLLGVPVAAFLILIHNPLVVVDPSFTLSFGAILSLGLLTTPVMDLLLPLRGNRFAAALLAAAAWTAAAVTHWPLVTVPQVLIPGAAAVAGLFLLADRLDRRGLRLPDGFRFDRLPPGLAAFLASQVAIQVGMMLPLSAFYFNRWPLAGAYANLAAIPLIGVIVQLGAIGGLLGLVPGIGPYIGLLMGAANWVFSTLFLWLGHAGATGFPYPFLRRPDLSFIAAYYALCAVWIWRAQLTLQARALAARLRWPGRAAAWMLALPCLALATVAARSLAPTAPDGARVTALSVGYGGATLVESPGGKRILIDAGFVEHVRGRRNEALRTVIPHLCHRRIRRIDALILSSARPERIAGAAHVLEHVWIGEVLAAPSVGALLEEPSATALARKLELTPRSSLPTRIHADLHGGAAVPGRRSLADALARRGATALNRLTGWTAPYRTIAAGEVLFRESTSAGEFRIEVLHPLAGDPAAADLDNGSLVLRIVHGGAALLIAGDLRPDGVAALAARSPSGSLRADSLILPHHAAAGPAAGAVRPEIEASLVRDLGALFDAVRPRAVIAEFGRPSGVPGDRLGDRQLAHELTRRFVTDRLGPGAWHSTDRDGAILAESDGRAWTLAPHARSASGEDDAVPDLAVGL